MSKNQVNFLNVFTNKEVDFSFLDFLWILLVVVASILLWQFYPAALFVAAVLLVFIAFVYKPEWGMYAVVATGLLIGWDINLSVYDQIRELSFISNLNAPVVDFIAFLSLLSIGTVYVLNLGNYNFKDIFNKQFGFYAISLFLISGFLSVTFVYDPGFAASSLYYYLRNVVFIYLAFVVLPVLIIRDRQMLHRVLWVLFWVGFVVAIFGAISFVRQLLQVGIPRVSPFALYGFAPLKYNHNILAEALVAVIPISGYLAIHRKDRLEKKWMFAATGFIILIALLTLSRAAWICVSLQLLIAAYIFKTRVKSFFQKRDVLKFALLVLVVPIVGYMTYFLTTNTVTSSNQWRIEVLRIVTFYFRDNPIFGFGPGTYINVLEGVKAYAINFGEPLDAHGFIQKVLLEQGLFGISTFFLFLSWILSKVWRAYRKAHVGRMMLAALFISASTSIVFQLFNTSYYNSHMWLPIGLALAGVNVFERVKF